MNTIPEELLIKFSQVFTSTLFKIGENYVSLRSLLELVISFILVLIISQVFTNFLKERLLVKLGIDAGNREAISRDYEWLPESAESMIYIAMIRNMLRRLA